MDSKELNLYQKILKITESIGSIKKTGKNQQQGYGFIEQSEVMAELRPQLVKWGVVIQPETVSRTTDKFQNSKGTTFVHANVVSRYTVINADNPEERFVSEWDAGEAMDTSDKATNKAVTASQKTYLMKLFNISDKDDADKDSPEAQPPKNKVPKPTDKATPKQKQQLMNMMKAVGMDKDQMSFMVETVLGKPDVTTVEDYNKLLAEMEAME